MKNHTEVLLRMEQRLTNLETFINRFDFSGLPEISYVCEHESDGQIYSIVIPKDFDVLQIADRFCPYKCKKCGGFYK